MASRRTGKWSREEEEYSSRLIHLFELGAIDGVEGGTTLRAFLSARLNCAPMRISKKYAGKAIGKHVFQKNEENRVVSMGMMPPTRDLEAAFLRVCLKKQGFAFTATGTKIETTKNLDEYQNQGRYCFDPAALAMAARLHYQPDIMHKDPPAGPLYPMVDASQTNVQHLAAVKGPSPSQPFPANNAGPLLPPPHSLPVADNRVATHPVDSSKGKKVNSDKALEALFANFQAAQQGNLGAPVPQTDHIEPQEKFHWASSSISPMSLLPMQMQRQEREAAAHDELQKMQGNNTKGKPNAQPNANANPSPTNYPWPDFYDLFSSEQNPANSPLMYLQGNPVRPTQLTNQSFIAVPTRQDHNMTTYGAIADTIGSHATDFGYVTAPTNDYSNGNGKSNGKSNGNSNVTSTGTAAAGAPHPTPSSTSSAPVSAPAPKSTQNSNPLMTFSSLKQHQSQSDLDKHNPNSTLAQSSYSHPALRPIGSTFKSSPSNGSGDGGTGSDPLPGNTAITSSDDTGSGNSTPPNSDRPVSTSSASSTENKTEPGTKRSSSGGEVSSKKKKKKKASSSTTSLPMPISTSPVATKDKPGISSAAVKPDSSKTGVVSDSSEQSNSTTGSSGSSGSNSDPGEEVNSEDTNSSSDDVRSENSEENSSEGNAVDAAAASQNSQKESKLNAIATTSRQIISPKIKGRPSN
ncbi:hypothetical protein TrVE_jg12780 [Triparma verrucosa]|uniref:Uncharacterized protein n=1 Tax=Triparma verrucosa TaxID=1606542 RepID=A0A9W7F7A7_9STRA|nr:hypothetical protein TrVE_jg12780 [Triparma verrucosa]